MFFQKEQKAAFIFVMLLHAQLVRSIIGWDVNPFRWTVKNDDRILIKSPVRGIWCLNVVQFILLVVLIGSIVFAISDIMTPDNVWNLANHGISGGWVQWIPAIAFGSSMLLYIASSHCKHAVYRYTGILAEEELTPNGKLEHTLNTMMLGGSWGTEGEFARNILIVLLIASPAIWLALTGYNIIPAIVPPASNLYAVLISFGMVGGYLCLWSAFSWGFRSGGYFFPDDNGRRRLVDVRTCMTQPHTAVSEVSMTPLEHLLQECEAMQ